MGYSHFAKMGDIWKHLPLCEVLKIESPKIYIESNAAFPYHTLTHTPEQEYGIYTFLERKSHSRLLETSEYSQIIERINENHNSINKYLGSPGLAMEILGNSPNKYIFYDLDPLAIENLNIYTKKRNLDQITSIYCKDSLEILNSQIHEYNHEDFIHFDPYDLLQKNQLGLNFLDLFVKSTKIGVKNLLWYGFHVTDQKDHLLQTFNHIFHENNLLKQDYNLQNFLINLKIIQKDSINVNPGVLGCGVMVSNLSVKSTKIIRQLQLDLVKIYQDSRFLDQPGDLVEEFIVY